MIPRRGPVPASAAAQHSPAQEDTAPESSAAAGPGGLGVAGVAATAASIVLTVLVAALGPSAEEPALPGRAGQPPWSFDAHPSPYLAVGLTAAAILAGAFGLATTIRAVRRGWRLSPQLLLTVGLLAAAALTILPPYGSSDHLSYAAYGRMAITGHNPYLTGPDVLARLGDPIARAVEDWKTSPSVYGALATGGQMLASLIGGTSVRLTVFVLSVLNLIGFAGTGLLLHRLAAGDRGRQLRAALLWTCNPLLLAVLVAGEHVDSQAIVFGVATVAAFTLALRRAAQGAGGWRCWWPALVAGLLAGLSFAVKLDFALIPAGLGIACLMAWRARAGAWVVSAGRDWLAALGGLVAGFVVVTAAALGIGGLTSLRTAMSASSYVAISTPWRWLRSALHPLTGEAAADDIVKVIAAATVLVLVVVLLRGLPGPKRLAGPDGLVAGQVSAYAGRAALAFALAWLTAGPYVLPWYDALAWAMLPLLPWSVIDYLVVARTASLAIGYLPARTVAMPSGLGWLVSVVRTAISPALLLIVAILLVISVRSANSTKRAVPAAGSV
jgi:hypothetical protein